MLDGRGGWQHTFPSAVELDGDALVHVLLEIQDVLLLWSLCWRPPLRTAGVTAPTMSTTAAPAAASSVPAAASSPAAVASAAASASVGHDLVGWSWVARGVCR